MTLLRRLPMLGRTEPDDAEHSLAAVRSRGRIRGPLMLVGPAFVAAIAYVDPGNFATNFAGGASFGYELVWVIVAANLMAMVIQSLSGKLGLATGLSLPELCREHYRRPVTRGLWVQAEAVAMATDLAEIIGGAIALQLLFDIPLFTGGLITGAVAFALLGMQSRGFRPFERVISGLLLVIFLGFLYDLILVVPDPAGVASGLLPSFSGTNSVLLAAGILGATVMPHVIYLHSALTQRRVSAVTSTERRVLLRYQRIDVVVAMGLAGLVNLAMLVIAAELFFGSDIPDTDTIEGVHAGLQSSLGTTAALAFALALLASGFASSGVGTYSGQIVMQGFLRRQIPLVLRRAVAMAPALIVLAIGVDPTQALIISQVVLSFGIPFALVPLILLTRRGDIMGDLVNRRITTVLAGLIAAVIIALNLFLLSQLFV
ncbi:MAG: Nramp family divalent metal transporter [Geodermatophilaceae bacterium]